MAKTNEVAKMICLFGNCKISEADNVMHVKALAMFGFSYAALLAGVVIALPSAATLALPVCAIVSLVVASFPVVMVRTAMPLVGTVSRAEAKTSRALERSRNNNALSALFTSVFVNRFGWRLRGYKPLASCFCIALLRTHRNRLGSYLKRLTLKFVTANLAGVSVVVLAFFSPQLVRAFAATCRLSAMLQALRISGISFFAVRANAVYHGHIIA